MMHISEQYLQIEDAQLVVEPCMQTMTSHLAAKSVKFAQLTSRQE